MKSPGNLASNNKKVSDITNLRRKYNFYFTMILTKILTVIALNLLDKDILDYLFILSLLLP